MSKELDSQLADLIASAKSAGQDAYAFVQSQAPDVIEQLIRWKIVSGVVALVVTAVLIATLAVVVRRITKGFEGDHNEGFCKGTVWVVGAFFAAIVVLVGGVSVMTGVKACVAPKLVVMEAISQLVSK